MGSTGAVYSMTKTLSKNKVEWQGAEVYAAVVAPGVMSSDDGQVPIRGFFLTKCRTNEPKRQQTKG